MSDPIFPAAPEFLLPVTAATYREIRAGLIAQGSAGTFELFAGKETINLHNVGIVAIGNTPDSTEQWRVVADFGRYTTIVFQGIERVCRSLAQQLPGTTVKSEDGQDLLTVKAARAEPFHGV